MFRAVRGSGTVDAIGPVRTELLVPTIIRARLDIGFPQMNIRWFNYRE
jgi:hypothetical protein